MKTAAKLLLLILLFAFVNSFAKGKVCCTSPKDLLRTMNYAYKMRDGATFYYLLSKQSKTYIEKIVKSDLPQTIAFLKNRVKKNPEDKMSLHAIKLLTKLLKSTRKAFYANLYKAILYINSDEIPKKIDAKIIQQKKDADKIIIRVQDYKGYEMDITLIKEKGCLKFDIIPKIVRSFGF